jgi:L-asparaginase/Glu-tRNA(Gln) amidotransferase subunit D
MRAYTSLRALKQAGAKVLNRSRAFFGKVNPVRRRKLRQLKRKGLIPCQWKQLQSVISVNEG